MNQYVMCAVIIVTKEIRRGGVDIGCFNYRHIGPWIRSEHAQSHRHHYHPAGNRWRGREKRDRGGKGEKGQKDETDRWKDQKGGQEMLEEGMGVNKRDSDRGRGIVCILP